jgi:hypothetical protein
MPPRFACLAPLAALLLAAWLPAAAAAQPSQVAMRVHVPHDAAIASVNAHAGEARDLCAPGEQLRRESGGWVCSRRHALAATGGETYQVFELGGARAGAPARFAAACLGPEDRVVAGTCVQRVAGGYVSFAGRAIGGAGSEAVECALDGAESAAAVGIAICLDVPPLR